MRIVLMSDSYRPVVNGVVNHLILLQSQLSALGVDVQLLTPGHAHADDEPTVMRYPGVPLGRSGYHLGVAATEQVRRAMHSADVIHVHHPFISGAIGARAAQRWSIPLVFTNHTRYDLYASQYLSLFPPALTQRTLLAYYERFCRRCAAIVVPSASVAAIVRTWENSSRVVVVPNGVDLERFSRPPGQISRHELGLTDDVVVAAFVGRMSGEKRIERLLAIYRRVCDQESQSVLLLVGDGPQLDVYRALAEDLALAGRVRFTGLVAPESIPDILALSDFFVSASDTEVHPLTIIEAAAAGRATLAFRAPGMIDVLQADRTGLLVDDQDEQFCAAFVQLVRDKALRTRLGEAAHIYSQTLSARQNAQALLELYTELSVK